MKRVGGKLFDVCGDCGQLVRLDKPIFGSLHICTTPEEMRDYRGQIYAEYRRMKEELERA